MPAKRKANEDHRSASKAPRTTTPCSDLPMEEIDAKGDVILVVGEEGRLRVSSSVLASASDAFKAMFEGPFMESQNLSSQDPPEVSLEDDDYKGALLMCLLLHHRFARKDAFPLNSGNIGGIIAMAVFADKYRCKESVGYLATMAINLEKMQLSSPELLDLTVAGYLLRSRTVFGKCSQMIIFDHGGGKLRHLRKESKLRALFPEDLCEILEEERASFQKVLVFNLRLDLQEKTNHSTDPKLWPKTYCTTRKKPQSSSQRGEKRLRDVLNFLDVSEVVSTKKLLEAMRTDAKDVLADCSSSTGVFCHEILNVTQGWQDSVPRLCLACFRKGYDTVARCHSESHS